MVSTDHGMQIDLSDAQLEKADSPRLEMQQPSSKSRLERFTQSAKQDLEIVSIDEGIQIE
jgi:hypothetical protein